jgi:hypothetical protein
LPENAATVLEELESSEDVPGQVRLSAEHTLIEWRAGNLSFDW